MPKLKWLAFLAQAKAPNFLLASVSGYIIKLIILTRNDMFINAPKTVLVAQWTFF